MKPLICFFAIATITFVSKMADSSCGLGPDPFAISDNEFVKACQLGETDKVRILIKAGADINERDKNGIFPCWRLHLRGKRK